MDLIAEGLKQNLIRFENDGKYVVYLPQDKRRNYVLNLYQRQQVFFKLATNWNNQSGVGVDVLEKIPVPLPA